MLSRCLAVPETVVADWEHALERALAQAEWVVKRAAPTGKASKVALETERQF